MEFKGTKGKWEIDKRASLRVVDSKGTTIANASSGQSGERIEIEKANAKLISAAPELLEALKLVYGKMTAESYSEQDFDKVEQAIKKALGGE